MRTIGVGLVLLAACGATKTTEPVSLDITVEATTMHVASIEGYGYFLTGTGSHNPGSNGWAAEATVTVVDDQGQPVEDATVSGDWVIGSKTISTRPCQGQNFEGGGTASNGACRTNTGQKVNHNITSVTYTVTGITHATLTYDPSANVVSSIVIQRPVAP